MINRNLKEREIENILIRYPYLIDDRLIDGKVKNQYKIILSDGSKGYIDIIYFKSHEITVIELKKDEIIKSDITQLSEYVNQIRKEFPKQKVHGYLVGKEMPSEFERSLNLRDFKFKKLGKEIPIKLKLCTNCRKALRINDKMCKWCNNEEFMPI